jgi:hypothetical protein
MKNIAWLESLATMTHYDIAAMDVLKSQPGSVQQAYKTNNQSALNVLLGDSDRSACKNTIFQL